jgi:hypothetical protein
MRNEFYTHAKNLSVLHLFVLKGASQDTDVKETKELTDTRSKIIAKLKYKIANISRPEIIILFEIT